MCHAPHVPWLRVLYDGSVPVRLGQGGFAQGQGWSSDFCYANARITTALFYWVADGCHTESVGGAELPVCRDARRAAGAAGTVGGEKGEGQDREGSASQPVNVFFTHVISLLVDATFQRL